MRELSYLNLDLLIERAEPDYRVRVLASPAGETGSVSFHVPFSDLEIENFLLRIGRPRRDVRRINTPQVAAIKDFGGRLFETVFTPELRRNLDSSISHADAVDAGLRIRLRLSGCPELSELPWEYLFDREHNRFLSLSDRTPLVRYLEVSDPVRVLPVTLPLRILVVIASPSGFQQLDGEREWSNVTASLNELVQRGRVEVKRLAEPTPSALARQLRRETYHVFHFIGHGGFDSTRKDGVLAMEDDHGYARLVSGEDLGTLLHDHRSLRLAVLNACEGARGDRADPFSGSAQSLVQQGVPAVLAMQFEITDEAAITFGHVLYEAVADGYPLDAATAEARKAIYADGNATEWATPVLYLRAPDGRIFDVQDRPQPAFPPSSDRPEDENGAPAPQQAEERTPREAEQKAKQGAEERARREGEQEAEERARREGEQKAKQEAEERARREAEQKAKPGPNGVAPPWRPSRSTAYFAVTGVLAILGILLAFFGPESPVTEELTWDADSHMTQARADLPEGTVGLSPTLLGLDLPRNPIPLDVDANTFDIGPQRLFLAGPVIAEFHPSGEPVRLVRSGGSWWSPLLTIPGVVMVLGALFSFAYGESLLRPVWERRGTVRTGELVGMAGAGAVLGVAITVAGWIAGNVPAAAGVLGVVLCLAAAAALLPYAAAALPQHRGVILAAVPLALLVVLSITWTAVGISGGGQVDATTAQSPTPSSTQTPTQTPTKTTPPGPPPKWHRGTDLPEPLESAGVTVFGDAVWVVGGNAPSAGRPKLDKVWFYKNGWQPGPKLPVRLDSMPVASDGKRLFVVGGQTSDSKGGKKKDSRVVWVLDGPDDDSWRMLTPPLPDERSGGAAAWDGQRLVFAGGLNHQDLNGDGKVDDRETVNHADVWVWEGKDEWRPIGQLQRPREDLMAASDGNGRVWFLGGADDKRRVPLGAVDLVEKDRITPQPDIDPVRTSSAVWLADRGVCLFGGVTRTKGATVACVPKTASPSPTIRPLPPLTLPRAGMGAAVQGKTIWLVGGFGPERKDGPIQPGLSIVEVLVL